jgi:hypothetical protein
MNNLYDRWLQYCTHSDPEVQELAQKLSYKAHQIAKKFADARDGYERQGIRYTKDEKLTLVLHSIDYLLDKKYPDFEEISKHMKRTPEALQQQLQKLFVESNWTCVFLVENYGITLWEAQLLIAPQHKVLNK